MPIRINLLNETQTQEDLRRRDPVKRAMALALMLVALSLVWFSFIWVKCWRAESNNNGVKSAIAARQSEFTKAQADIKNLAENERRLAALQMLHTNRFLQGNLLNALQQVYTPNVQLTRAKLDQTYIISKSPAPAKGTPAKGEDKIKAPPPPTVTRQTILTLDAKDTSPNPGDQISHFRDAIAALSYFKNALSETNAVRLLTTSAPQSGQDGKPYVQFTLECRFADLTR